MHNTFVLQEAKYYYMEILIIFFLILLNGIFSMSEIALVSAKKFRLETDKKRIEKVSVKPAVEKT